MLLLLCALLQEIEGVRTLTEGAARAGCWLPIEVRVRGPYDGDVVVRTDVGARFIREVRVPPGAVERVIVPAVVLQGDAKVTASLGREGKRVPLEGALVMCDRDLIVGEIDGQPRIVKIGDRTARLFKFLPADWSDAALFESIDGIIGNPGAAPLELLRAQGGRVIASDADLDTIRPPASGRFEMIDPLVGPLLGRDPWIPSKREKASLVLALYFFVLLLAFAWLGTRRAAYRWLLGAVLAASTIFTGVQALVPRGQVGIIAWEAETGDAAVRLIWIAPQKEGARDFEIAGLAKPVFERAIDATRAEFDVVVGERTRLRGVDGALAVLTVSLRVGGAAVTLSLAPWLAVSNEAATALGVHALLGGRNAFVKEMPPGDHTVAAVNADEPAPTADDFRFFAKRLLHRDCVFGWYRERDRVYPGATGPDVAESRAKPRFFVVAVEGRGGN